MTREQEACYRLLTDPDAELLWQERGWEDHELDDTNTPSPDLIRVKLRRILLCRCMRLLGDSGCMPNVARQNVKEAVYPFNRLIFLDDIESAFLRRVRVDVPEEELCPVRDSLLAYGDDVWSQALNLVVYTIAYCGDSVSDLFLLDADGLNCIISEAEENYQADRTAEGQEVYGLLQEMKRLCCTLPFLQRYPEWLREKLLICPYIKIMGEYFEQWGYGISVWVDAYFYEVAYDRADPVQCRLVEQIRDCCQKGKLVESEGYISLSLVLEKCCWDDYQADQLFGFQDGDFPACAYVSMRLLELLYEKGGLDEKAIHKEDCGCVSPVCP